MPRTRIIAPEDQVVCPVCKAQEVDKICERGKSIYQHLSQMHKDKTVPEWLAQYPELEGKCFLPKPPAKVYENLRNQAIVSTEDSEEPELDLSAASYAEQQLASLKPAERKFFDEQFDILFQQVDRNPALIGDVISVCMITMQLMAHEAAFKKNHDARDLAKAKYYHEIIEALEDRRNKLMKSLALSGEARTKNRTQIRSSVASLISGFDMEVENMTPEMIEKGVLEEQKVLGDIAPRIQQYILAKAPEREEHSAQNNEPDLDIESVIRDADSPF